MFNSRNLLILTLSVVILSVGQDMWFGFAPEFLRSLGASVIALGLFSSGQDFFKALYHYPGGWLNDRFGLRGALVIANLAAGVGYFIYLISPNFVVVFFGLPFVMMWPAFIVPATIGLLGDTLPLQKQPAGFALQAVVARLPGIIAPVVGGALIGLLGDVVIGVRVGLAITIVGAVLTLILQGLGYQPPAARRQTISPQALWNEMSSDLKRLLASEILVSYAEALPRALIILYAINILQAPALGFGFMLATEAAVAVLVKTLLPRVVAATGQKPIVLISFLLTALFPITVFLAPGWGWLFGSFVIAGLKASGGATRGMLKNALSNPDRKGQHLGLYESLLSLAILPAGIIGGVLWFFIGPWSTFWLALLVGLAGCAVYWTSGPGTVGEAKTEPLL
jgi:MFS family permease